MRRTLVIASALCVVAVVGCSAVPTTRTTTASPGRGDATANAAVAVSTFDSAQRIDPVAVRVHDGGSAIRIEAARGEREGAQLVAEASRGSAHLAVDVSDLTNDATDERLASKQVTVYAEQALVVERGSPNARAGTYLDPLLDVQGRVVPIHGNTRFIAWVDVAVPREQAPGTYRGELRLVGGSRQLARIPITVTVRDATLPRRPTLDSYVGLDLPHIAQREGVQQASPGFRNVLTRYTDLLADSRLTTGDLGITIPGALPGDAANPANATWLRTYWNRPGVSAIRLPLYETWPFADPLGRDRPAVIAYLRRSMAWLRARGWADRAYVFVFDEPGDDQAGAVRELNELLRVVDPSLRQLVTREPQARAFSGFVDIWSPNINPGRFDPAAVARARRAGQPVWWYPSITTYAPWPDLFIDERRPAPRALGWLAWRYRIDGVLYWTATHWQEVDDPWHDSATFHEGGAVGNGDGVLLYPGAPMDRAGHPAPSVRLFQLRDGIDDHDLLTMAWCAGSAVEHRRIDAAVRTVAPSMTSFDANPADIRAMRSAAFDAVASARVSSSCVAHRAMR